MSTSTMSEFLADSDFFIALYKSDDENHKRALHILEKIEKKEGDIVISVLVYAEIATVLSQRIGKTTAHHFMHDVEESGVHIIQMNEELFNKTKEIFATQRSKNVSFTDASNIALARMKHTKHIVSFDKDYKKNGLLLFG